MRLSEVQIEVACLKAMFHKKDQMGLTSAQSKRARLKDKSGSFGYMPQMALVVGISDDSFDTANENMDDGGVYFLNTISIATVWHDQGDIAHILKNAAIFT